MKKLGLLIGALLLGSGVCHAQTAIFPPGQPPTYVYPQPNGGYVVMPPGQPPIYGNTNQGGPIVVPIQPAEPSTVPQIGNVPYGPGQIGNVPYGNDAGDGDTN